MTHASPPRAERGPRPSAESLRILRDCRDLAAHRFVLAVSAALDRIADLLGERAERSTVPADASSLMNARDAIAARRGEVVAEFERLLRAGIDERCGAPAQTASRPAEPTELKLLDDSELEESVLAGDVARALDDLCESELGTLTQRIGALLGNPELERVGNPFAPLPVCEAFRRAWESVGEIPELRQRVLREMSPAVLGDIKGIYADLNRHLVNLNVLPELRAGLYRRQAARGGKSARTDGEGDQTPAVDLMATLQRVMKRAGGRGAPMPLAQLQAAVARSLAAGGDAGDMLGAIVHAAGGGVTTADPPVVSALTRLQTADGPVDLGDGTVVRLEALSAAPRHNVLRDIQESALGDRMNQVDAMTIELVAMLFDFVFLDRNVPDSVKAMVGRLQIPVLKAAMLDRAFFSKKSHPARVLVNRLAHAGVGWSPESGHQDPLYVEIESIVNRVTAEFTDDLGLFSRLDAELEGFLAREEKRADSELQATEAEVERNDRLELARLSASAEIERRLLQPMVPTFIINLMRRHWIGRLVRAHADDGGAGDTWAADLALVDDLIWSVQPKRSPEDRRRFTAMLPALVKRLNAVFETFAWTGDERKALLGKLVQAHTSVIKSVAIPPAVDADEPEVPAVAVQPDLMLDRDEYDEIASSLARGTWVEFEADDGKLAYAKLAWVSPLRGTLLFSNRQGQQAFSLTPRELAERFRADRARPIDAEPLVDRALTHMVSSLSGQAEEPAHAV